MVIAFKNYKTFYIASLQCSLEVEKLVDVNVDVVNVGLL
jgi:hypothetical protein